MIFGLWNYGMTMKKYGTFLDIGNIIKNVVVYHEGYYFLLYDCHVDSVPYSWRKNMEEICISV